MSIYGIDISDALLGTLIGLGISWFWEQWKWYRRRRNVAGSLVMELRVYRRSVELMIKLGASRRVYQTDGFSQQLFFSVLDQVVDMPSAFGRLRQAYAHLNHLNYLVRQHSEIEPLLDGPSRTPYVDAKSKNFADVYPVACDNALKAVDAALDGLRSYAGSGNYTAELPPLRLSEMEKQMCDQAGRGGGEPTQ